MNTNLMGTELARSIQDPALVSSPRASTWGWTNKGMAEFITFQVVGDELKITASLSTNALQTVADAVTKAVDRMENG